jgi:hypothetical protein
LPQETLQCKVSWDWPSGSVGIIGPGLIGFWTLAPWMREADAMATRSRLGLGPVFAYEWRTASRRWHGYALRSLLVLLLLLGLSGVWLRSHSGAGELSAREWAKIGQNFYSTTTLMVLGLVGLVAPAATAGAICLDKAHGNLTLLFATDLTDVEIVLGKLAARLSCVITPANEHDRR